MSPGTPLRAARAPEVATRAAVRPSLARTLLRSTVLLAIWALATATDWDSPRRPLSDDEKLALTVSQSDAIVIGQVLRVSQEASDYTDVALRPLRWLKGSQGPADLHVGMFVMTDRVLDDIQQLSREGGSITGVFFLRRSPSGWMISDYPGGYNAGRLRALDSLSDDTAETRAVEAMVARQGLDSLLLRADLVVLGRHVAHGRVRADSVLAGRAPSDTLEVDSPILGVVGFGPALYFLRRVAPDQYEVVDFHAGSVAVQADTLARLGIPLRQVFQRAAELRPRRAAH